MHCKKLVTFFSKKIQHICVSLDVNFNESLTNDIVSFEQLGPVLQYKSGVSGGQNYIGVFMMCKVYIPNFTGWNLNGEYKETCILVPEPAMRRLDCPYICICQCCASLSLVN